MTATWIASASRADSQGWRGVIAEHGDGVRRCVGHVRRNVAVPSWWEVRSLDGAVRNRRDKTAAVELLLTIAGVTR